MLDIVVELFIENLGTSWGWFDNEKPQLEQNLADCSKSKGDPQFLQYKVYSHVYTRNLNLNTHYLRYIIKWNLLILV